MKNAFILAIGLSIIYPVQAQDTPNFNEWFRQKKTQIKYLTQQIVALQVYLGYLKKGYEIVDNGLTTIGNIKDGTLNQDQTYLNSLRTVGTVVRNAAEVESILVHQRYIVDAFKKLQSFVYDNEYFTEQEKGYIQAVHLNMLRECQDSVDELNLILNGDETQMTDDDRLARLDKVHEEMLDKYSFTRAFISSTQTLAIQRAKEDQELKTTRRLIQEI